MAKKKLGRPFGTKTGRNYVSATFTVIQSEWDLFRKETNKMNLKRSGLLRDYIREWMKQNTATKSIIENTPQEEYGEVAPK